MAAYQQSHVTRNAEVNFEGSLLSVSFFFPFKIFYVYIYSYIYTMIHTVFVLYLNLLILHVAVPFDYNKCKWPVPYR